MTHYSDKFETLTAKTSFSHLTGSEQNFIRDWALRHRLTYQELRQVCEFALDLQMWQEPPLENWAAKCDNFSGLAKNAAWQAFIRFRQARRSEPKTYPATAMYRPKKRLKNKINEEVSERNIYGDCPVASPKTICCNLKTIDAVESCVFGCSYCTIQTFYNDTIHVDAGLGKKLQELNLDPERRYHIGTGQSADSLAYGNRGGILDDLIQFARTNSHVMLEFKTKSDNIRYFEENGFPPNVFCSWSLNPQIIIDNEEHFTASLEKRLLAAQRMVKAGMKIAFHFHPMIWFDNWRDEYTRIARNVMQRFQPEDILFISFGSVTFIKPVLRQIRNLAFPTKITQMDFVTDPHGKLTYPDEIKIQKFSSMYDSFREWHDKVFFYLCMEKAEIWEKSFGWVFPDNDTFEQAILKQSFSKIYPSEREFSIRNGTMRASRASHV